MCLREVPRAPVSPSLQVHLRKSKKSRPQCRGKTRNWGADAHRARLETGSTSGSIAWWGGGSIEHLGCYPACPTHLGHGREQREQGRCQRQLPPLSKVMAKVTPLSACWHTGWAMGLGCLLVRQVRVWETQSTGSDSLCWWVRSSPQLLHVPGIGPSLLLVAPSCPPQGSPGPSSCWLF